MKPTKCTRPGCKSKSFESKMFSWVCKKCRISISKDIDNGKYYVQMEK